jgi:hypothetical protein
MKKEEEEFDKAVSGAFGKFQEDPGAIELLSQPPVKREEIMPAIMPFQAMSDPGRKKSKRSKSKRSKSKRSRSKRARSANQVSRGRKTPEWAKRKKARPAPARSRGTRPKSWIFTGRYS